VADHPDFTWRARIAPDGLILSLERVESVGAPGEIGVFYFTAPDRETAERRAHNQHAARRMREKRASWRQAAKCTRCGADRDVPEHDRCSACLKKKSEENARRLRREHGEDIPVPSRTETLARRREEDAETVRLETLEQADAMWVKGGVVALRKWLRDELNRLRRRAVA
jgi:hypothetical protein